MITPGVQEPENLAKAAGAHLENPGKPVGEPADQYRLRYLQLRVEIFLIDLIENMQILFNSMFL